jgi:carboxyl-terminal processing protease
MLPIKSMAVVLTIALSTAVANSAGTAGDARRESSVRLGVQRDTGYRMVDSTLAVATFDSAWRTIGVTLERRGVTRLDWPEVRRELLPRAARAATDSALRAVIDDMLSRIGESHFALMPAQVAPAGDSAAGASALGAAGLALRVLDSSVVVWRTDSGGAARRAGVLPGWTVERIDDVAVPSLGPADSVGPRRLAVLTSAMRALRGAPGTTVHLVARDASGMRRTIDVTLDSLRGPLSRLGNLPPLPATFEMTRRRLADGRCAAVIHFEYWMPPVMPALDRAVDSARNCAGIILDLRGNLGGVAGMMMGVAGHFMNEPRTLGIMRSRGEEMRFVANPRRATDAGVPVEPFTGDVAILVDGLSASTSEMFAAAMQAIGRARVFGERTAGQALPAMATRLPSGDVLMHVVADFVAPDGTRIEGRGVIPDEVVPLTRADLVAGRDAPLESAILWFERPRPRNP